MMNPPGTLPLHLMLALMQQGALQGVWTPWSANYASLLPEWMRPKTPLEQASEEWKKLWENLSEGWLNANPLLALNQTGSAGNSFSEASSRFAIGNTGIPRNKRHSKRQETSASPFAEASADKQGRGDESSFADFFDPEFLSALSSEAMKHSTGFLLGIQAYLASDYTRPETDDPVLWKRGNARLLDLAPGSQDAVAVLCIPSLINQSTILDLYPGASFARYLAAQGFRPLILDWGTPGDAEADFAVEDYIAAYALEALEHLRTHHNGPIALLGYCMGGIFAVAMAQLAAKQVDALVLLATPWDFASEGTPAALLAPATQLMLRQWIQSQSPLPPMVMQTLFHLIDPWRVQRKFSRYPFLDEVEKERFLAIEQWVNEGVPLAARVAEECFVDWPQGNILARHQWKVGRKWIEPSLIACPTLAVVPTKDAIVPFGCALPLTKLIKRCDVLTPDTGHVSMVAGSRARKLMWEPVAEWLDGKFN